MFKWNFSSALVAAFFLVSVNAFSSQIVSADRTEITKNNEFSQHSSVQTDRFSNRPPIDEHINVILEMESASLFKAKTWQKELFGIQSLNSNSLSLIQSQIRKEQESALKHLENAGITFAEKGRFSKLYNGLAIVTHARDLKALRGIAGVKKVHVVQDRKLHLSETVSLIEADEVWRQKDGANRDITGKGVVVAVLDSGIDYTREELGGCFGDDCRVRGGYDYMNDDDDPMDDNGYGTHVAGIIGAKSTGASGSISGVAPDVTFLAYKVCDYYCPTTHILAALEKVVDPDGDPLTDDGVDIVNMSLGGGFELDDPLTVAVNELAGWGDLDLDEAQSG